MICLRIGWTLGRSQPRRAGPLEVQDRRVLVDRVVFTRSPAL